MAQSIKRLWLIAGIVLISAIPASAQIAEVPALTGLQIPESDFSQWHTEKLPGFLTFGTSECSEMPGSEPLCWDCGNPAFSTSGSKKWPTQRVVLPDGSTAAMLKTRKVVGVIASGNLFTGRIMRNMGLKELLTFTNDGNKLIDWGIPYKLRPRGYRIKFSYDGLGDECSVTALLENHEKDETGKTIRHIIATALYIGKTDSENQTSCPTKISEKDTNGLRTLEVLFVYGERPEGAFPLPDGTDQVSADTEVTHVNVIIASSARGDYFKGVKNATLIVKDFELLY